MHESIDKMMAHKFLDSSQKRGKALEILLPKVNKDDVAELLAELYDLRRYKEKEEANKKAKEYLSTEEVIDKLTEKCKERKAKKKKAKK